MYKNSHTFVLQLYTYSTIIMNNNTSFEWDDDKNKFNFDKHGVTFEEAQLVFEDEDKLIFRDDSHRNGNEIRYFCIGKIDKGICTVRFVYRNNKIRIFGAGYWRKERKMYEKNKSR